MGKCLWTSVVIQRRKLSWTKSVSVTVSISSSMKSRPRWQFWSKAQPPWSQITRVTIIIYIIKWWHHHAFFGFVGNPFLSISACCMNHVVCCYIKCCKRSSNLTPLTHISHSLLQKLAGLDLLSLSHGDISGFKLQPLSQGNDGVGRIWTHWQEADEWSSCSWFLPHPLQVKNHPFCVLLSHCIHYVFTGLEEKEKEIRQSRCVCLLLFNAQSQNIRGRTWECSFWKAGNWAVQRVDFSYFLF